jgi:5-methylcytosine-specific restriction endonuclease McrA
MASRDIQFKASYGYCHCGCGHKTSLAVHTNRLRGLTKGQPTRYVPGHAVRRFPLEKYGAQRRRKERLVAAGICYHCGQRQIGRTAFCEVCRENARLSKIRLVRKCKLCDQPVCPKQAMYCAVHRTAECVVCGASFHNNRDNEEVPKCCSRACRRKYRSTFRGERGRNWRGGRTKVAKLERRTLESKQWRSEVFERGNWTCQDCGTRGGFLHAHHIKEFAKHRELRWELSNGLTLCKPCHHKRHRKV